MSLNEEIEEEVQEERPRPVGITPRRWKEIIRREQEWLGLSENEKMEKIRYYKKSDFKKIKSVSSLEAIRWVADNSSLEAEYLFVQDCPSPHAWNLIVGIRTDPKLNTKFWNDTYLVLMKL